jgi:hypothetical protein
MGLSGSKRLILSGQVSTFLLPGTYSLQRPDRQSLDRQAVANVAVPGACCWLEDVRSDAAEPTAQSPAANLNDLIKIALTAAATGSDEGSNERSGRRMISAAGQIYPRPDLFLVLSTIW